MLFKSLAVAVAGLAGLAQAVQFTTPLANKTLEKGSIQKLEWSTVDTDPSTLSIYLVNFVTWPPLTYSLAENLDTFKGQAYVKIPCDVDSSYGYQFNAINGTNTYVIYAQTDIFSLKGNCTKTPSKTVTVVEGTDVCEPVRKVIFKVEVDKIWFCEKEDTIRTCDATATVTQTATEVCTVTKTVDQVGNEVPTCTVTVTVNDCGKTVPSPTKSILPVFVPSGNTTVPKPPVKFTSGASNVQAGLFGVMVAAVIGAIVM